MTTGTSCTTTTRWGQSTATRIARSAPTTSCPTRPMAPMPSQWLQRVPSPQSPAARDTLIRSRMRFPSLWRVNCTKEVVHVLPLPRSTSRVTFAELCDSSTGCDDRVVGGPASGEKAPIVGTGPRLGMVSSHILLAFIYIHYTALGPYRYSAAYIYMPIKGTRVSRS